MNQHIHVNGSRLYYETVGFGQAVVLLHGFTLDTRMWDDQFWPLAQQFRVIRYDMRGFGRLDVPTGEPYSHVADLAELLDSLGIVQVHLVGLSKGGAVAIDFALTHPGRVLSLVLVDTVLGGFDWSAEGSARDGLVWQRAREGGVVAAKESWLTHPLFAPAMRQPAVAARLKQMIGDYSGWHFVNDNPEMGLARPSASRLSELAIPVLAIVGELDLPDFQRITNFISEQVPQARRVVMPGVGHMANMEAPEAVLKLISAFYEEVQLL
ncbi:MAG: alpha/beta fold hydrolase [Chloroflexi bacterium]|nr:alpha/beta fold hydrolase [Ardenticatenaceae bacterium]MBL1128998.1 alpha/beta fold hydrolase [Chloroflexota bacterium]NOG35077.1 alpha/beta fold hydrolase [Chloroflexota bacterium]